MPDELGIGDLAPLEAVQVLADIRCMVAELQELLLQSSHDLRVQLGSVVKSSQRSKTTFVQDKRSAAGVIVGIDTHIDADASQASRVRA